MVKRAALAALLICAACLPLRAGAAQTAPYPVFSKEPMGSLIRDDAGILWGAPSDNHLPLCRKMPQGWQAVDAGVKANRYKALTIGEDGNMYALLIDDSSPSGVVVRFTKDGTTTIGSFPINFSAEPTQILALADGSVFVTGASRDIRHILGHGKPDVISTISSEAVSQQGQPQDNGSIRTIIPVSDGHSRVWFYSSADTEQWLPNLKDVVIWNHGTLNPISHFLGAPSNQIKQIFPKDKDHLWAIYTPGDLYIIDTNTLTGERVDGPKGSPMHGIQQIEQDGPDWLIVNNAATPHGAVSSSLWRLHDAGKSTQSWTKVLDNMQPTEYAMAAHLPICATNAGVWTAIQGIGVWWAPRNGAKPTLLDWKRDFPLSDVQQLLRLDDTHAIALGVYTQLIILSNKLPPVLPPSDLNFEEVTVINTGSALQPDSRAHLWGIRRSDSTGLDEWDGLRWISHPLPAKFERSSITTLIADNSDRIWCFRTPETQVEIFDSRAGRWEDHPNLKAAFESHRLEPGFIFRSEWDEAPKMAGNKLAAFWNAILYFDGSQWHSWEQRDISQSEYIDPHPYLDSSGQLSVYGSEHVWLWNGKTWNAGAKFDAPPPGYREKANQRITTELQQIGFFPGNTTYVPYATTAPHSDWFFVGSHLYSYRAGLARETFPDGQRNPYLQHPAIDIVREDAAGRIWLGTNDANYYRFVRLLPAATKDVKLNVRSETTDSITVNIDGRASPQLYEWQMDDEPASVSNARSKRFIDAAPGEHSISVVPLTHQLIPMAATSRMHWKSTISPDNQITNLISQLNTGTDQDRTAAMDALKRYGAKPVPALKAARASATENGKWWIDTALQTIENQDSTNNTPEIVK